MLLVQILLHITITTATLNLMKWTDQRLQTLCGRSPPLKKAVIKLIQTQLMQEEKYPPPLWSSGVGTPVLSPFHGLCPGLAPDGGPAPDCVLGSSPRADPDCGTCGVCSFPLSGCDLVPWNALAYKRRGGGVFTLCLAFKLTSVVTCSTSM